jgi:NAD-specific glutamate dehydrogenase
MVIMPRDRYSGRARRGIQAELIRQFDATLLNTNLVMGGGEQARLHFQFAARRTGSTRWSPSRSSSACAR